MLPHMTLLETATEVGGWQPVNYAIGISVFILLIALMVLLQGFGAGRPHS